MGVAHWWLFFYFGSDKGFKYWVGGYQRVKFLLLFKLNQPLWIWHCLCFCHWLRNDWLWIVIAGCCVSLLIDGLNDWISLHPECQMRNSFKRVKPPSIYSVVCCSQKQCLNMICRLIFLAGSCLASVIWPLLILWSITLANNQNERFLSPCLHRYIYYWHHPNCQVPNPYWPNCPGVLCTSATFTTWMKLILVTPTSLISTLWNALDAGINRADVLLRLE